LILRLSRGDSNRKKQDSNRAAGGGNIVVLRDNITSIFIYNLHTSNILTLIKVAGTQVVIGGAKVALRQIQEGTIIAYFVIRHI